MKRFLSFCMCLALVAGLMPTPAFGAEAALMTTQGSTPGAKAAAYASNAGKGVAVASVRKASVASVTIYAGSAEMGARKLKAKGLVASKAKWKSSKPSVASVSRTGRVSARKAGSATVTAEQGKATYKFSVKVKEVSINKTRAAMRVGGTLALKLAGDAVKSTATSSKKVATVSKAGLVRGKSSGRATITITSKKGRKFKCTVSVVAPPSRAVQVPIDAPAQIDTPALVAVPEPVVGLEPVVGPTLVVGSDPAVEPEPIVGSDPAVGLTPIVGPEPVVGPTPIGTPDPVAEPDPVVSPEPGGAAGPSAEPGPAVTPEPGAVSDPAAEPGPVDSPGSAATPDPVDTPEPSAGPEPSAEPGPGITLGPIVEPTPGVVPATGIAFEKGSLVMQAGGPSKANKVTVSPSDATDKAVTYTTSDAAVATVSGEGVIAPGSSGTATVTATTANGKAATCEVRVCAAADYPAEAAAAYAAEVNAAASASASGSAGAPRDGAVEMADLAASFDGPAPRLGWVYLEGGVVKEYEFYFDDVYLLKTKNQTLKRSYDPAKLVNVKDEKYGAVGDGQADDDAAVKAAMKDVNDNGGILYFPPGTYRVAISTGNGDGALTARSEHAIEIDFGKSTLELQANAFQAYAIVRAVNCADVELRNGTFVGDRRAHDYESLYQSSHEWGKGVQATNNAKCSILNMDIAETTGDAIYCSNSGAGTTVIADCALHHCRRQGISVISGEDITVRDTDISHIGCPDETDTPEKVRGTAPMAGIDLEPNSLDDLIKHMRIENVSSHDNATFGLVEANTKTSAAVLDVEVVNCRLEKVSTRNSITFDNCELTYPPTARDDELDEIKDCTIRNSRVYSEGGGMLRLRRTTADNCTFEGRVVGESGGVEFRLIPMNATITNSTFKNIQGKGPSKWATGAVVDVGIPLADYPNRDPYCMAEGSGNNTYEGCGLLIDNLTETGSTFKDCHVMKRGRDYKAELAINRNRFENCTLKLGPDIARFVGCTLINCAFTGTANNTTVYLLDSTLTCDSIASKDYFPKSVACDASTVEVLGDVAASAFANVRFANLSKIVLDGYASAELEIPLSSAGVDYVLECRGSAVAAA